MIIKKNNAARKVALFGNRWDVPGFASTYQPEQTIHAEGAPARLVYQVLRGVVRTYNLLDDGRRQIAAFHFAGDVFGLEPVNHYGKSAEAVTTARVAFFRRERVVAAASQSVEIAREVWAHAAINLERAERHILLLGRKTAMEKVEDFLIEMDRRGRSTGHVNLPMPRRDIADYLGLTIETVSRVLGQMQDDGRLSLSGARKMALRPLSVALGIGAVIADTAQTLS